MPLTVFQITTSRTTVTSPEQTAQLLASLARATLHPNVLHRALGKQPTYISLEVAWLAGQIRFFVVCPSQLAHFVISQVMATYPQAQISKTEDYLSAELYALPMRQTAPAYFPLRDYADYKIVDPMLPMLGVLAKAGQEDKLSVQFVLSPASTTVPAAARAYITPSFEASPEGKSVRELPAEEKAIIKDKLSHPLLNVSLRFASSQKSLLVDLAGSVAVLDRPDGNSLRPAKILPWQTARLEKAILQRTPFGPVCTLNVLELASLWHLPGEQTNLPNLAWVADVAVSEAPENLPAGGGNSAINFFASTTFQNQEVKFGLKLADRLRHMYVVGKSGSGKSTLLENMAVDDFKKGHGVAFIDPHGDTSENLLNYIPRERINDTIYFNPADRAHPIAINILEVTNPDQAELIVSGIVAIFHKLYGKNWGPRLEYLLRNALLTLAAIPGSTLPDVVKILADNKFRQSLYPKITNTSLLNFWHKEFDTLEPETRLQYIYPILNKIGQFVNSPLIQGVISHPKSSIDLGQILNTGKIFLANLSQGKLGEDNATLLGAMLITKFELAAMERIATPASERREFFLYVDELQNFATASMIKILSEARKFKLGLILANQYLTQLTPEIQQAIFGNVGTLACFVMGAEDAKTIAPEFAPVFDEMTLTALQKYQIALKMTIDDNQTRAFSAFTLPPLKSTNQNKAKVVTQSQARWSAKI